MRLIVGNWKMNGMRADGIALARAIARSALRHPPASTEVLICPPATLIGEIGAVLAGTSLVLGAQDCAVEPKGAFTGDVSAPMLADLGCRYVILGHSERRQHHGETNATIARKVVVAQAHGLAAIVCIGESALERERGEALAVVTQQLAESTPSIVDPPQLVVAYEPVWAIGSGRTPNGMEIAEVHDTLRRHLRGCFGDAGRQVRLLYGGSVTSKNAAEILNLSDVDGALVGGASLKADDFWAIVQVAN